MTKRKLFLSLTGFGYWLLNQENLEAVRPILDHALYFFGCGRAHVFGAPDHPLVLDENPVNSLCNSALSELVMECHYRKIDPRPYVGLVQSTVEKAEHDGRCVWRCRTYPSSEEDTDRLLDLLTLNCGDPIGDSGRFLEALRQGVGSYPGIGEVCNEFYTDTIESDY